MEGNSNQPQKVPVKGSAPMPDPSGALLSTNTQKDLKKNEVDKILPIQKPEEKGAIPASFSVKDTKDLPSSYQKKSLLANTGKTEGYEVRTMQHDVDETKGKKVKSVSIAKDAPKAGSIKTRKQSPDSVSKFSAPMTIDPVSGPKEGVIGKLGKAKTRKKEKVSLGKRIKYYLAQRRLDNATKPKRTGMLVFFIIVIFIGGFGYYIYTTGAFSSLEGIFDTLLGRQSTDPPIATTTPPTATTTPPTGTTTIPTLPIDPGGATTTPITTPTDPPVDPIADDDFIPSDPFFEADSEKILYLKNLAETFDELKEAFDASKVGSNQFERIVVTAEENLSGISLAQIWKGIKSLAIKGDDVNYTELLSSELIESWGLAMTNNIYGAISENYNLFFYGQPDDGPRAVLVFRLNNSDIADYMMDWETTMVYDLKNLFLGQIHGEQSVEAYQDNLYKDAHIRYLNLPESSLTMDHAIVVDSDYLILTTSREAAWATVDRIVEANPQEEVDEFADWQPYENKEYGYKFKYPPELAYQEETDINISFRFILNFINENTGEQVFSVENPIPEVGYEAWATQGIEKVLIPGTSNKYLIKDTMMATDSESGLNNLLLVSWNHDSWENSGLFSLGFAEETDGNIKILDNIISTFELAEN